MTVKELIDKLQQFDEDKLSPEDIDNFIKSESCTTAGKKTTIGVLTCLTGFVLQWAINGLKKK